MIGAVILSLGAFVISIIAIAGIMGAKSELYRLRRRIEFLEAERRETREKEPETQTKTLRELVEQKKITEASPVAPVRDSLIPPEINKTEKKESAIFKRIERHFVENWTGIAGSVLIVLGAGFMAGYAALHFQQFSRFVSLVVFSVLMFSLSFVLKRKEGWSRFSAWIRSISGAVLLFACLGAGHIQALKWIENEKLALVLLITGTVLNAAVGYIGKKEGFVSFHTFLSVTALMVAPYSRAAFIAAVAVSFVGVASTYREKWEVHLLVSISSFFVFNIFKFVSDSGVEISKIDHMMGIASVILISFPAVYSHYSRNFEQGRLDRLAFITHLLNWVYLGSGLYVNSLDFKYKPVVIALAALGSFALSRKARSQGVTWLFITDSLVSLVMAYVAALFMADWKISGSSILAIIYFVTLVYSAVMLYENEMFLSRIGLVFSGLTGILITVLVLTLEEKTLLNAYFVTAILSVGAGSALSMYADYKFSEKIEEYGTKKTFFTTSFVYASGVIPGLILSAVFAVASYIKWWNYIGVVLLIPFMYTSFRYKNKGLLWGGSIAAVIFSLAGWLTTFDMATGVSQTLIYSMPFFAAAIVPFFLPTEPFMKRVVNPLAMILFSISYIYFSYRAFVYVSPFLPGALWLACFTVAMRASSALSNSLSSEELKEKPYPYMELCAYLVLFSFIIRHFIVHFDIEDALKLTGSFHVKYRVIVEVITIVVLAFEVFAKKWAEAIFSVQKIIRPFLLEVLYFFILITVSFESEIKYVSFLYAVTAILILVLMRNAEETFSRARLYSLFTLWISSIQLAVVTGKTVTPDNIFHERAWLFGVGAVLLQFLYLYLIRKMPFLEGMKSTRGLFFLETFASVLRRWQNAWAFYPVFVCAAIFLYFSFDRAMLSLLWVLEAFLVFIMGVLHREDHFRYVSMGALALCLIRIIFHDMVHTEIFMRAIVFLGTGAVLLLMNMIYNKYKDRFWD